MTRDEMFELAMSIADGSVAVDMVDWSGATEQERRDVFALAIYELTQRRNNGAPQRRAKRLFRSWLTARERKELSNRRCVTVRGASGAQYRIWPNSGVTHVLEQHGKRMYARASFCLDPDHWVPPADVALAHYLCIQTDEADFLSRANRHEQRQTMWDGAYLRRLNAARRERENRGVAA